MGKTNLYDILNHRLKSFYCIAQSDEDASRLAMEAGHTEKNALSKCIKIDMIRFNSIDNAADSMSELLMSGETGRVQKEISFPFRSGAWKGSGDKWVFVEASSVDQSFRLVRVK